MSNTLQRRDLISRGILPRPAVDPGYNREQPAARVGEGTGALGSPLANVFPAFRFLGTCGYQALKVPQAFIQSVVAAAVPKVAWCRLCDIEPAALAGQDVFLTGLQLAIASASLTADAVNRAHELLIGQDSGLLDLAATTTFFPHAAAIVISDQSSGVPTMPPPAADNTSPSWALGTMTGLPWFNSPNTAGARFDQLFSDPGRFIHVHRFPPGDIFYSAGIEPQLDQERLNFAPHALRFPAGRRLTVHLVTGCDNWVDPGADGYIYGYVQVMPIFGLTQHDATFGFSR